MMMMIVALVVLMITASNDGKKRAPHVKEIRLVGGGNIYEGRVEVFHNGKWGTICDDFWGKEDGEVACRQLGFGPVRSTMRNAYFGAGNGRIWMDNMRCDGTEKRLDECRRHGGKRRWGRHNCDHIEDASVRCYHVDDCATDIDACDVNATCSNTDGSFRCQCDTGYTGDGMTCTDVDECVTGIDTCSVNETCSNTDGSFMCKCDTGYTGDGKTCTAFTKVCQDAAVDELHESGPYTITPSDGLGSVTVYCDMDTNGGGWTVFQKRFDGSVNFTRGWDDYEQGFGSVDSEHWMGLRNIRRLVSEAGTSWTLRIDLEAFDGDIAYAEYDSFTISDAQSNYIISVDAYHGTAGNSLHREPRVQNNKPFSTYDRDNDPASINCAQIYKGGFWYDKCYYCNLNGDSDYKIIWNSWKRSENLKRAEMKIKRNT